MEDITVFNYRTNNCSKVQDDATKLHRGTITKKTKQQTTYLPGIISIVPNKPRLDSCSQPLTCLTLIPTYPLTSFPTTPETNWHASGEGASACIWRCARTARACFSIDSRKCSKALGMMSVEIFWSELMLKSVETRRRQPSPIVSTAPGTKHPRLSQPVYTLCGNSSSGTTTPVPHLLGRGVEILIFEISDDTKLKLCTM